jgi:hypothetical protein
MGSTFANHRITAVAGRGGMAVVYRAVDLTLERTVALKVIAPAHAQDPVFRARFEHECRLAASMDHPNVVSIFQAGAEQGVLYVTMRYVDGTDLKALLTRQTRLAAAPAASILGQVARGLHDAHLHGLVHRDVKPANVLITTRDGREHAYLTDFGVTRDRQTDVSLTATGFAIGTADYMARTGARRAGRRPIGHLLARLRALSRADWSGPLRARQRARQDVGARPRAAAAAGRCIPDLPEDLAGVVERALAKDPRDRQPSAAQLARDLASAVAGARS